MLVLFSLLFGCGLRRQEVSTLELKGWDKHAKEIVVLGKSDKTRRVPVPGRVCDILQTWVNEVRGEEPGPLLCRFEKGDKPLLEKPLSPSGIYHIISTWCSEFEKLVVKCHLMIFGELTPLTYLTKVLTLASYQN